MGDMIMEDSTRQLFAYSLVMMFLAPPSPVLAQVQTTISPAVPSLTPAETGEKVDADSTYCRPPQHRTDSRLMGPKVCMTYRKWNELHAGGLDVDPDGNIVPIQQNRDVLSH
jgi:hypothetical protein